MENIYKNPFSEYNANVMDAGTILEYWCNPFSFVQFGLNEEDVFSDPNPIVFMGGRGTGKTMFLRYCSFAVQKTQYNVGNNYSKKFLENVKAAGFYNRIDGPVLRSFDGFGVPSEKWLVIFTHYFELQLSKSYINFLRDLVSDRELDNSCLTAELFAAISKLFSSKETLTSLDEVNRFIDERLAEVTQFRATIPLRNIDFSSEIIYPSQHLSFGIIDLIKKYIPVFANFTFVILIDEYENFLESQQRMINTLLKFVRKGITFRLGMRLEGFRTYDTISKDDFIKEGRDYRCVIFEEVLIKDSGYSNYLKDIASKRLGRVNCFQERNLVDITLFLGQKEDLVEEAKEIVGLKADRIFESYKIIREEDRVLLRNDNPLLQLMNCIWYRRGKSAKEINGAMNGYINNEDNTLSKKYRMDYVDKYKLSLTILLTSIYKKDKQYYSFNTFSYLSSGIVGHFIELCRRCFQYAEFEDKQNLLEKGFIPKKLQHSAARDLAESELQQTRRIEKFGNELYVFTINLGSIFRDQHRDMELKYPETNQFSVEKTLLQEPVKVAFEAAQRWSIIQRKSKTQQQSIGKKKSDIFTLNRIFSPLFQISYRTRGGYSEEFSTSEMKQLMEGAVNPFRKKVRNRDEDSDNFQQELDFFNE